MFDRKKWAKMIEYSSSLKLNEIHMVDSPFNKDPKNITFSKEALVSGEGRPENLGKWTITGTSMVMEIGRWSISKENISPYPPGTKILVTPQFFYMQDRI